MGFPKKSHLCTREARCSCKQGGRDVPGKVADKINWNAYVGRHHGRDVSFNLHTADKLKWKKRSQFYVKEKLKKKKKNIDVNKKLSCLFDHCQPGINRHLWIHASHKLNSGIH